MSNKIIVFWATIIFLLLSSIFLFGKYYLKNKEYILLRQEFKENVKNYIKENDLYPKYDKAVIINKEILIKNEIIKEIKYNGKECDAEAKVSKKFIFYLYNIKLDCE